VPSPTSTRRGLALLAAAATGLAVLALPATAHALAIPITINSIAPDPFSPAGNSPKTETVVDYTVGTDESVAVNVSQGFTDVYDEDFGPQSANDYQWTWDGTDNLGQPVPDGSYTVTLTGSLSGAAETRTVAVDSTLPSLSGVHGGGITFYPVRDGYHDTWYASVHVSEGGHVTLTIKNAAGAVVRTMHGRPFTAGRLAFSWNGRNGSGSLVPAGRYHFNFTEIDEAANHRSTANYSLTVSDKKLVKKNIVLNRDGGAFANRDTDGCGSSVSKANSQYPDGVLLSATCGNRFGVAVTGYNLRLPGAIRYGRMSVQGYGYSHRGFAFVLSLVYSTVIGDYEIGRGPFEVNSSGAGWRSLGSVAVAGHNTRGHVAHLAFAVANRPDQPADFDLKTLRVTVGCFVLR
jgi:flagellar hook assembly protein FlgD